jgi:carbonic anhydrase
MKKLVQGIVDFRRNIQSGYREAFGRLAMGQSPDTLFIACSDSRVVPNTFASTNPGDLFVLRNMGNLIPPCDKNGVTSSDKSEAAAIEFSVQSLSVSDIIVCGHSECAAMRALVNDRSKVNSPNLKSWLRHGDPAVEQLRAGIKLDSSLAEHNQLSQLNVLLQIEHVKSYPDVKKRIENGTLSVHGWWFDIAKADVYAYDQKLNRFLLIDEAEAERLFRQHDETRFI